MKFALPLLFAAFALQADSSKVSVPSDSTQTAAPKDTAGIRPDTNYLSPLRVLPNDAFGPGEYLEYEVGYGFIKAGIATLEVRREVNYKGYKSWELVSTARSYAALAALYFVEDYNYSILDAAGIFPWHFQKNVHEGRYQAFKAAEFDQVNHKIQTPKDTLDAAEFVQDALSSLYYVRTLKLEVGKSVFMETFSDGKKYSLEVKVVKKERVSVPAGQFRTVVVEPLLKTAGIFEHKGKITVWLTDDRLRLPVLMKSKVLIGSISAQLKVFKLGEKR